MSDNSIINLVDTHCHLNLDEFDHDRAQVVTRAQEDGITRILIPGIDIETSKKAIVCSHEFDPAYAAVGIHPNSGQSWNGESLSVLKQLAVEAKVVAIGEIGLDYYREYDPADLQWSIFRQQLEFAADVGLPVIVHNRDASEDIVGMLKHWQQELVNRRSRLAGHPGVLHSFSGSLEMANEMVEHNFVLGIGGPVTYRNAHNLQAVVAAIPLENLIIETDSPFQTPHPFRGKRNEPSNVRIVAEKIAELKSTTVEYVAAVTTQTAEMLFNWREIH